MCVLLESLSHALLGQGLGFLLLRLLHKCYLTQLISTLLNFQDRPNVTVPNRLFYFNIFQVVRVKIFCVGNGKIAT